MGLRSRLAEDLAMETKPHMYGTAKQGGKKNAKAVIIKKKKKKKKGKKKGGNVAQMLHERFGSY